MGIDTIVKERHLLTHPFYQRWQKGKVPIDVLRSYSKQYYHYEGSLPSFLSSTVEHMAEGPVRDGVQTVLQDEQTNPRAHSDIWVDFAGGLGVTEQEVKTEVPTPRTVNLVETYRSLCLRGAEEGVAALYAYESQFPQVAKAKADGLKEFYGISDAGALEFFDLHTKLDVEHARLLKAALIDSELSRESAHLALDAWWGMLDQFEQASTNAA